MIGLIKGMRFGLNMVERSHEDILALGKDADLFVISSQSAAGKNEAELLDIPYLSVNLMPWAIPWDDPDRPLPKRALYSLIDWFAALITTQPLNRMRKRQGLTPLGKEGFNSPHLNLIPVSPIVYPPNPNWEPHHRVVGYWFVDPLDAWAPPEDLVAFLTQDDPPFLVSLGAMSLGESDALQSARHFIDAIEWAGVRAIIQGWESAMAKIKLPPGIFAAGRMPHSWLMSRCAGVIHHGGFGTTAATMRAGIPAFVIPHIADQFYWGERVAELGIGPPPIRRGKLERESLAAALERMARDESMRSAAAALGERIRAEEGVEAAVQVIEDVFP
jgi:UDP:flavonoid glycosyltransferase YjiC (YdhE family)